MNPVRDYTSLLENFMVYTKKDIKGSMVRVINYGNVLLNISYL